MQTRLYQRGRYLLGRGVMKPKVTVALARELCGFVWALLRLVPSGDGPAPAPELAPPASRSATRRSTRASSAHTQMR